ncbi:MAG TPA: peptidoglycan DD-metalloendopeptidase family protein [Steroidobacteraceae bacterium]|nr:peptidoglycan DD-metalloendopeptidase family protein [Steroidobacteraceae bacterium]
MKRRWPLIALLGATLGALAGASAAEPTFFRYKDENGNWVYTDKRPADKREVEQVLRSPEQSSPPVRLLKRPSATGVDLVVDNACFCPAYVMAMAESLQGIAPKKSSVVEALIGARSTQTLMELDYSGEPAAASFGYRYAVLFGDPKSEHRPMRPYRAPFAVAQRFRVTQAFPSRRTHIDAASFYAVDIAMPVGTQVYAAREGTVIEVAARFFEGSADPKSAAQANLIRILQPDGTMAIYAHLQWDSIRVRPGQIVKRGEYIANSGNTGFTTGPHLHFAVQRNTGLTLASVPVEFANVTGQGIAAKEGDLLAAY